MNNEFGLINLWTEGDAVTRFVAILLLAMSLASWVVIILKSLNLLSARSQASRIEAFWHSPNVAGGLQALGNEENNPFRALALRGQEALAHLKTSTSQPELLKELDTSDWVTRSLQNTIDDATAELQSGMAILRRWAPPRRLWACLARSGAFTTRSCKSAWPVRPPSTKWRARLVKPSS